MSDPAEHPRDARAPAWGALLRRSAAALLTGAGLTLVVHMALLAGAWGRLGGAAGTVGVLAGSLLWVVVAAPAFAAGAATLLEGLLRGAAVIDAGIVLPIVLAAAGEHLTAGGAVAAYLLSCTLALAACGLAWQSRRRSRRRVLAAVAGVVVVAVAAAPFWANAALLAAELDARPPLAAALTVANPVYATSGCLAGGGFVWHERPMLYERTILGRDGGVPVTVARWYLTALVYAAAAAALILRAALAGRRGGASDRA